MCASKYGADRVAQIITFGTLQARAVVRDVGPRAADALGQVDRLCKLVPHNPGQSGHAARRPSTASRGCRRPRDNEPIVAKLLDIASGSKGFTATPRPMPPAW